MAPLKAAGNIGVTYNSNALDAYMNQASLDAVVNVIETTNLDSTATNNLPGLPGWTVSIGGHWDATLDGYLGPETITPAYRTLVVTVSTVTYTWTTNAFISNYQFGAQNPGDSLTWSAELTVNGAPVRA